MTRLLDEILSVVTHRLGSEGLPTARCEALRAVLVAESKPKGEAVAEVLSGLKSGPAMAKE